MAAEIYRLIDNPPDDLEERRKLYNAARNLCIAFETPQDAMHRTLWSGAQLPLTQVGVDLQLFKTLSLSPTKTFTVEELAQPVNADPALVFRIVRYLSSFGLLKETAQGTYQANDTTEYLATVGGEGAVTHFFRTTSPIFQVIPETLQHQGYHNPSDPFKTAFQRAHHTELHGYDWLPKQPILATAFFEYLKSQRKDQKSWTQAFPLETLALSGTELHEGRVIFVDVGGGTGPQSIALRNAGLQGPIVLQDQASVLAKADHEALDSRDIQAVPHDFFARQPVQGAKAYYLKNVMHDWPDEKCGQILRHIVDAMAPDSLVLIHDCVLPDVGASWKQTQMDIQMMAALAAVERAKIQWDGLLNKSGLRIKDIYKINEETGNSVIVAVPTGPKETGVDTIPKGD